MSLKKKNMDPVLTFSIRPNFICLGCKVFKWFRTPDCVIWLGQKRGFLNLSTWTIMLFMFSCFCLFRRDRDRYDTSRSPSPRGKKNVKMYRVWRTVLPENTSILMARTWVSSKNESLNQLVQHNKQNHLKVLSNFFLSGDTWALRSRYKLCNLQLEPHRTT